jgi:hypothetical protein
MLRADSTNQWGNRSFQGADGGSDGAISLPGKISQLECDLAY